MNDEKILVINPNRLSQDYQIGGEVRTLGLFKDISQTTKFLLLSVATYPKDNNKRFNIDNCIDQLLIYEGFLLTFFRILFYLFQWPTGYHHCIKKSKEMSKSINNYNNCDFVIIEFPSMYTYAKDVVGKHLLFYIPQNVEYEFIKKNLGKYTLFKNIVLKKIYKIEKEVCEKSDIIFAISMRDKELINKLYKIPEDKILVIPNGVWLNQLETKESHDILINKAKFGVKKTILFIGSAYKPNIEAVKFIYTLAKKHPNYDFLIVGSSGFALKDKTKIANIKILGNVDDEDKKNALIASDIALNPVLKGAGTNLKMFEYLAMGIPVISTDEGNRGLNLEHEKNIIISELEDFSSWIDRIFLEKELYERIAINGQKVSSNFDWSKISEKLLFEMKKVSNKRSHSDADN